jgi:uncharacterized protein (TIGR02266 family)
MDQKPALERRRDRRHPHRMRIILTRGGQDLMAQTEDVSFAGVFIRMDTPLPARQLVRLRLTLPDGEELSAMGMVARHIPAREDLSPGVGIQFYSLSAGDRRRWNEFIRLVSAERPTPATIPTASHQPVAVPPAAVTAATVRPATVPPVAAPAAALEVEVEEAVEVEVEAAVEPIRRSFPRYAASLQVRLNSVDDLRLLYTRNVSKGGLYFDTSQDFAEGTALKVAVVHPKTHEQFPLEAVVRWRNTSADPGLGLEFVQLSDERREEFFEFVRSEIAVEEVVYVSEGDPHLTHFVPTGG